VDENMTKASSTTRATSKVRSTATAGYPEGEETRQRILEVALEVFGDASYQTATTRRIADAAGVSLPTLQYYFGDKEGLYRACAETIVQRYRRHTQAAATAGAKALSQDSTAKTARLHLKALIHALAGLLVGSREVEGWAQFVTRELRDPGPAFTILYENLWRPGVLTVTRLIARILSVPEGDPAARIRALLLLSSVTAFQSGRSVALRTMGWSSIGAQQLELVVSGLEAEIDAIGR
jgi:TetR/AcrR family transcriptional regulator, regulator of cefoperazone and chloramphenicol sensitivity